MLESVPVLLMRGGTSKGVFLREEDAPPEGKERDRFLLRLMGSPDPKQIDGLGGAQSVTSKVAIIGASKEPGVDVDYTFAQVSVDKPVVSYAGNCGNISSAVGPYAVETGLVAPADPVTRVTIFNTNTRKRIVSLVQTPGGKLTYGGDCAISGVPGTAAPVKIFFERPGGAVFGKLLPTGNVVDQLDVPELGAMRVSIVDSANPLVFVAADSLGLTGTELPTEMEAMPGMLDKLERVRGVAAQAIGLTADYRDSATTTPGIPKMTVVAPPRDYVDAAGNRVAAGDFDILGRMMSMQRPHPTYAMTGAICTASAACIPGTIVHEALKPGSNPESLLIGSPSGLIEAGAECVCEGNDIVITQAYGIRTARLLLKGVAHM